jgi:hypothetical protein
MGMLEKMVGMKYTLEGIELSREFEPISPSSQASAAAHEP